MSSDVEKRANSLARRRGTAVSRPAGMQAIGPALWARIRIAVQVLDAQQGTR